MPYYVVLDSFVDIRFGSFTVGEVVEFTEENARDLPVMPVRKGPPAETADLHLENLETTDAKPVRKGRDHAHPARFKPK